MMFTRLSLVFFILLAFVFQGCAYRGSQSRGTELKTISIVDRNGMTETINNTERIKQYQSVNFFTPQPYKQVLLIHARDSQGNIPAYLFSYHENGIPRQYLEATNSRAYGNYKEWYPNGCKKAQAFIIGGEADLCPGAEKTWLFDGLASAWDQEGNLLTQILYKKGALEGISLYYHDNGSIWRSVPFKDNQIHGLVEVYLDNGELFQKTQYVKGMLHGTSYRYWPSGKIASEEEFQENALIFGRYFDIDGKQISQINEGNGYRAIFGREVIAELHQFRDGFQEGEVKVFGTDSKILRKYHVKNNFKHGEEIEYFDLPYARQTPKLSVTWYEGKIQGIAKTWYEDGVQESSREMSNNAKNGISTAWYRDGNLMLIEEYEQDKLLKGEYYRRGEKHPISTIKDGNGTATLFDSEGNFVRKVFYEIGAPTGTS